MRLELDFWVPGRAEPKGSTRSFVHPRTGKVVTMSANTRLRGWESDVRQYAAAAASAEGYGLSWPVVVAVDFVLSRPRSVSERRRPLHTVRPDLDKLLRAVLDGLDGIAYLDDAQVWAARAVKRYAKTGETPGARVRVYSSR